MKKLLTSGATILLVLLTAVYVQAQDLTAPKREFRLGLSSSNIELVPGQTTSLDINIYRSKSYKTKEISFLTPSVPEGMEITFDQDATKENLVVMTLKASEAMASGKYTVLLQGKTTRVTKGITLTVLVDNKNISKK